MSPTARDLRAPAPPEPRDASERAAAITTRIESAKLNGHDPWAYFKDVLERLPTLKNADLHLLLPHNWVAPKPSATVLTSDTR